jgi:predicted TIM-barrel fold metal-dependent hydrolase
MIVDAHAHICREFCGRTQGGDTRSLSYGRMAIGARELQFLPPYQEKTQFTAEMLLANMEWAGVDRAVLLQGPTYGECNKYVSQTLQRQGARLAGAAYLDPWESQPSDVYEEILAMGGFCAIKLEFAVESGLCGLHPNARLDAPELDWLWARMEADRFVLVLDLGTIGTPSYQSEAVDAIAKAHPALRIVLAHLGQPTLAAEADPELWCSWEQQIDLGKHGNVWFDTSALPAKVVEEGYPYPSVERYLRLAVGRIGAGKLMWGSDQPGLLSQLSLPQLVELGRRHIRFLPEQDQQMVLGGTALKVYGRGSVPK